MENKVSEHFAKNIFEFRKNIVENAIKFSKSFTKISSSDIRETIEKETKYWPEPLVQINPEYQLDETVEKYAKDGRLYPLSAKIFTQDGKSIQLYDHQAQAIRIAANSGEPSSKSFVVTTGTGSGKSLSFFIPIVDRILREKAEEKIINHNKKRTRAIVIYPMNALANSQLEEINKFLKNIKNEHPIVTVGRYTGQETNEERIELKANPPDILLTNYMMLELLLMRHNDKELIENCQNLEFLVLDELHTYRGRQGADVALLVRRLRSQFNAKDLICIGTSATMSSAQDKKEQNSLVASVASKIFGIEIPPENVISEVLRRVTDPSLSAVKVRPALHSVVEAAANKKINFKSYEEFKINPLSVWLEQKLSISPERNNARAQPNSLSAIAELLSIDAKIDKVAARQALENFLSLFGRNTSVKTDTGRNPFAFKLHQFISGPGKVYLTLEDPGVRFITLDGQLYKPESDPKARHKYLYTAHFCKNCGHEFFPVWPKREEKTNALIKFEPRDIDDIDEELLIGYLTPDVRNNKYKSVTDLPENWLDKNGKPNRSHRNYVPQKIKVDAYGEVCETGKDFLFISGHFRFCPHCLSIFTARGSDKSRLLGLSGEGRSSATTNLTLSMLWNDFSEDKKILGFSDNRQDAALQSGHFNDFIDKLVLRTGLLSVLRENDKNLDLIGLSDEIIKKFQFEEADENKKAGYLLNPKLTGNSLEQAGILLRANIRYKLLCDLKGQTFYTRPNLEDLGLVTIEYRGLEDWTSKDSNFAEQPVLNSLSASERTNLFKVLLDYMRKKLCISSAYLNPTEQFNYKSEDLGYLTRRWSFKSEPTPLKSQALIIGAVTKHNYSITPVSSGPKSELAATIKKLSFRSSEFQLLKKQKQGISLLIERMIELLYVSAGIIDRGKYDDKVSYYQIPDGNILWGLGHRSKKASNTYFRNLYEKGAESLNSGRDSIIYLESSEHTAQLNSEERQELELRFRHGQDDAKAWKEKVNGDRPFKRLPVLFCSPTMELGIDISNLDTVYMRNVPPTPANYVQRAGRAGRSGQQALALTYCASLSPHDQWFFENQSEMVQGIVKEPTLDLTNPVLWENHLHSIWLSCLEEELPSAIAELVEMENKSRPLKESYRMVLNNPKVRTKAIALGHSVVKQILSSLSERPEWYSNEYVEKIINESFEKFDRSLDRWRKLLKDTEEQIETLHKIAQQQVGKKRDETVELYKQAMWQKDRLVGTNLHSANNDFYIYRYLANQGFLPGYSFPTLPMLAWIPEKNEKTTNGTILSRARFLGLSEFGPRNLIYHRGKTYRIERVKIGAGSFRNSNAESLALTTSSVLVCPHCGYCHPKDGLTVYNVCELCNTPLNETNAINGLFKIDMVETKETERITCEDEERRRHGYELLTIYRFSQDPVSQKSRVEFYVDSENKPIAHFIYAPFTTLWKLNLGDKRRADLNTKGFQIDPRNGTWKSSGPDYKEEEVEGRTIVAKKDKTPWISVVPFVKDSRNVLIFEPVKTPGSEEGFSIETMATLAAALKRAIVQTYQLESSEISVQPLPSESIRNAVMFYETSEGGAGVLKRIATDSGTALSLLAEAALEIMHYVKPKGGWNSKKMVTSKKHQECVAGCYKCLLSYYNQPEHRYIDRRDEDALEILVSMSKGKIRVIKQTIPEVKTIDTSSKSKLERWLSVLRTNGFKEPTEAPWKRKNGQYFDAMYKTDRALVKLSPVDEETKEGMEELGWKVLDFSIESQWDSVFQNHLAIFKNIEL